MRLRAILGLSSLAAPTIHVQAQSTSYDLIIVQGTPGGISTAVAAAKENKTSLILERTEQVGGLVTNGLGATDIATPALAGGFFKDFADRVRRYYVERYGEESNQTATCQDGFHFEAQAAEAVFGDILSEVRDKVTVLTRRQFDFSPDNLTLSNNGDTIESISVTNLQDGTSETYRGRFFIDASYEGDLIAAAGVPFVLGRESNTTYGEPGAGKTYKLWQGGECPGTTHEGDHKIQSYNYRLCLTSNASVSTPFTQPSSYNRSEFASLVYDVKSGLNDVAQSQLTPQQLQSNIDRANANLSPIPDIMPGLRRLTNNVALPNGKADANNQHRGFISTDLPTENIPWPTSPWTWRDAFAARLQSYTAGLLYFAATDPALPQYFRDDVREWGYCADTWASNAHFPRQVYVREGRRMNGTCFFTAHDALPLDGLNGTLTPPIHADSVGAGHYALDSHAVSLREQGRCALDGMFQYPTSPYTIPYGVMVPVSGPRNLLSPVPISGSHIGFSTLRLEPAWMAIGQAAGVAAAMMLDNASFASSFSSSTPATAPVLRPRDIDIPALQSKLLDGNAVLYYDTPLDSISDPAKRRRYQQDVLAGGSVGCGPERAQRDYAAYRKAHELSGGAIAGIVVGVVLGVAALAALGYFLWRRKSRGGGAAAPSSSGGQGIQDADVKGGGLVGAKGVEGEGEGSDSDERVPLRLRTSAGRGEDSGVELQNVRGSRLS